MKYFFSLAIFLFFSVFSFAQVKFEKGYLIDNEGKRSEVFIKNADWRHSPTAIEYKLKKKGAAQKATIEDLVEFGFDKGDRFTREKIKVDISSDLIGEFSTQKEPEWEEQTVFLKWVVEGKTSLFALERPNYNRFYYRKEEGNLVPLVFKKYMLGISEVEYNDLYKDQLIKHFHCHKTDDLGKVQYNKNDLRKVIVAYNKCIGQPFVIYRQDNDKVKFHFGLRAGLNFSKLKMGWRVFGGNIVDVERKQYYRFGAELESVLPFNKNKWSIVAQPSYHYYKHEEFMPGVLPQYDNYVTISSNWLELPVGIRHYFFLGDKFSVFINGYVVRDFRLSSEIEFESRFPSYKNTSKSNYSFASGIGIKYGRFSGEFRFAEKRDIFKHNELSTSYSFFTFLFGINIF